MNGWHCIHWRTVTTVINNFRLQAANHDTPGGMVVRLAPAHEPSATFEDAELHAYVDGVLEPGRRSAVERMLARDPGAWSAATSYRDLNIDLHRLLDGELPPLAASLDDLARELERRLASGCTLSSHGALAWMGPFGRGPRRLIMRGIGWLASKPLRGAGVAAVLDRAATAIDRSPLGSVVVVAGIMLLVGVGWPMLAGEPASCVERVDTAPKQAAWSRPSPELAEKLASVGSMCRAGETERADRLLARPDEASRSPSH